MGPLARLVGGAIGYASEANAARKASKSPRPSDTPEEHGTAEYAESHDQHFHEFTESAEEHDEQDWQFDEVQAQEAPHASHDAIDKAHGVTDVVEVFFHHHPQPPPYEEHPRGNLPCPVIIPQKRPGGKTRGFVRAYAPDLEACGIDESTFLDFEYGFERAIRLSPAFHAMQLVVVAADKAVLFTAGVVPIVKLISLATHISIEGSRRAYMNVQDNNYLDQMNEKLFKPKGLYAIIVKFKASKFQKDPEPETVDLRSQINNSVGERDSGKNKHFYSSSSGRTHNEFELPETCPLVFPELEALSEDKQQNAFKRIGKGLQDYGDRKARAEFDAANTDGVNSKLDPLPPPEFASRFADPNHPARNGNIVNLITGGAINRPTIRDRLGNRMSGIRERGANRRERVIGTSQAPIRDNLRKVRGVQDTQYDENGNPMPKAKKKRGLMNRIMQESVLYLMIVNMPTDEEVAEAKASLAAAKEAEK